MPRRGKDNQSRSRAEFTETPLELDQRGSRAEFTENALEQDAQVSGDQELAGAAQTKLRPKPPAGIAARKKAKPELRSGQVNVDDQVYHVIQGDLLLDPDEYDIYGQQQQALAAQFDSLQLNGHNELAEASIIPELFAGALPGSKSYLVGILQGGKLVRWPPGTILTYCVLRQTFPREEWYEEVVDNMQAATADWEATCGVKFSYVPDLDDSANLRPAGVVFPVRFISAGGAFIAAAFFPNDPVYRRRLLIDASYFSTQFDHVGVLRHELGHVLGFRHEHIRSGAPPVCPDESTDSTIDLTAYDPQSCMHYFCGGIGSRNLAITEVDRVGSQRVYGPPLGSFEFAEM